MIICKIKTPALAGAPSTRKKEFMKLSIEMEAEDWLDLCALHKDVMEIITSNMANDPIAYSSAARITNQVFDEVLRKLPSGEIDRILDKRRLENG